MLARFLPDRVFELLVSRLDLAFDGRRGLLFRCVAALLLVISRLFDSLLLNSMFRLDQLFDDLHPSLFLPH